VHAGEVLEWISAKEHGRIVVIYLLRGRDDADF
jgi:hypothetical protein